MADNFLERIKRGWNAFRERDSNETYSNDIGPGYSSPPSRVRLSIGNERSIISSVYTRIGLDVAALRIEHVRQNEDKKYVDTINSGLNNCLTTEANIDQPGRALIQDAVLSMFDEGSVAIVPVDTTNNPHVGSFDILTLRTARILEWYPYHVRVNLYNDRSGNKEDILLLKKDIAIIENPLYSVMNEPNSTLQRLIRKLNLLDSVDEQSSSGKLDLIVQLPFTIKTPARRVQAEARKQDIENQLKGSKYGIAYIDAAEKVTQLNRPAENNLMAQIEYLTSMLYSQLGMTPAIFDGTADEATMINYHNRTVGPVVTAIIDNMVRSFLTKTARSQGQTIMYFRNPFAFATAEKMASMSDTFTRNAIISSNEVRAELGLKPSKDPEADSLRNKNLNPAKEEATNSKINTEGVKTNEG